MWVELAQTAILKIRSASIVSKSATILSCELTIVGPRAMEEAALLTKVSLDRLAAVAGKSCYRGRGMLSHVLYIALLPMQTMIADAH